MRWPPRIRLAPRVLTRSPGNDRGNAHLHVARPSKVLRAIRRSLYKEVRRVEVHDAPARVVLRTGRMPL